MREQPAKKHPEISQIYEDGSDFIHLSGRHYGIFLDGFDEDTKEVRMLIGPKDSPRDDDAYFEIIDAFFEVSEIVATFLLEYCFARSGE